MNLGCYSKKIPPLRLLRTEMKPASAIIITSTILLLRNKLVGAQNCTICQEDRVILDPDQPLRKGGSCGEVDSLVKTLSIDQCADSDVDIVVAGIRCGCRDEDQFPVCGIRQNPSCKLVATTTLIFNEYSGTHASSHNFL